MKAMLSGTSITRSTSESGYNDGACDHEHKKMLIMRQGHYISMTVYVSPGGICSEDV